MGFKHITSRDNPIFKQLKRFADSARERKKEKKTLLDGVHLISAYMEVFGEPDVLIIPEGKSSIEATGLIQSLSDISTVMLPTLMFAELTPVVSSTGILALVSVPQMQFPQAPKFVVMLEDIQDPGNLGSMLRTAAAAGVDAVYLSEACTDAWSPKALRGGQGAQFVLPVVENVNIVLAMNEFRGNVYATSVRGESLFEQDLQKATAFVIGNEGNGLREESIVAATKTIHIPMSLGSVESLNAAAALAVCLFERVRQSK